MKKILQKTAIALAFAATTLGFGAGAQADTTSRQFQFNLGFGGFFATEGLDASFDFDLEPEFFFSEHTSLSLRLEGAAGDTDSFHLAPRFRYYFDIGDKLNLFVGAGIGYVFDFDRPDYIDIALPTFGYQYDITEHFKIGAEMSLDIILAADGERSDPDDGYVAFGARIMPVVLKWAF